MALTVSNLTFGSIGDKAARYCTVTFDASYPTGGEALSAAALGLATISEVIVNQVAGYTLPVIYTSPTQVNLEVFQSGGFTPAGSISSDSAGTPSGTNAPSAVAGTADAQPFTGTDSALNIDFPSLTGVGLTAVGQDITTTDNHTMSANQYRGMWLISATGATPPNLILSNTAVVAAPAVFTVQGSANTDAGAYSVVSVIPRGVNAASALSATTAAGQVFTGDLMAVHSHTFAGTPVAAGAGTQVPNATNLSTLVTQLFVIGN